MMAVYWIWHNSTELWCHMPLGLFVQGCWNTMPNLSDLVPIQDKLDFLFTCPATILKKVHTILYSKTCLKRSLKNRKTKVLKTNGSLMKVESIAILQCFWPALRDNPSWKPIFDLLFEWPLKTGFTVFDNYHELVLWGKKCGSWSVGFFRSRLIWV